MTAEMANTPSIDGPDSPKVQIVETVGEDKSYKYSFTYEKATLYEFKFTRAPTPDAIDPCYRCNRRVLPKDQTKIDSLLFHKQCFRCRICGLPLTHKTYHRNSSNNNKNDFEVYCRTHIGKNIGQIQRGEVPPMGVEGPSVEGQGKKYIVQVGSASYNTLFIFMLEFQHTGRYDAVSIYKQVNMVLNVHRNHKAY